MKKMSYWKFGDNDKEADNLVNLVLIGKKRATSSFYESYKSKNIDLPKTGDKIIIKDSKNRKRCLIVITKAAVKPFGKVSSAFAAKEGEGNRSLTYWRKVHKKFFAKRLRKMKKKFSEDILVVCEEFRVVKIFKQ
ncbi:MAG: ASCH domain-containing protein [Nanoarchaeota archaeon]